MLYPYDFHTSPETLLYYHENAAVIDWFSNTRTEIGDVINDANAEIEFEADDDDDVQYIGIIYRVNERTVKLYSSGEHSKYIGHIDLKDASIIFYDNKDSEICKVPANTTYELYEDNNKVFNYIQVIFDIELDGY